jgi:alanine racemase
VSSRLSVIINLDAIADNWRYLQSRLGANRECGAVVKANAYGLGMAEVAECLAAAGCRTFFVANVNEGVFLRGRLAAVQDANIYILQGVEEGDEQACLQYSLRPVLISADMVRRWAVFCAQRQCESCAVKLNTGMNRLGLDVEELDGLLVESPTFWREHAGLLLSHLACADEPDHPLNYQQLENFERALMAVRKANPTIKASFANSSGIFLGQQYCFDVARPGAALYGLNPTPRLENPMRSTVRLALPILQTRITKQSSYVGYGAETCLQGGRRLAVVAGGYADGVFRAAFPKMVGSMNGVIVPLVGRVSMDTLTFDITEVPRGADGGHIEILGNQVSADAQGLAAGTIGYEVLTRLGERVRRVYKGGKA